MNWRVPLSDVQFGSEEKQAVLQVLESGWLAMGEITNRFEQDFAVLTGAKHAIAVTNGTASLHLACRALDLGPGDEVIVPSLTFVATANAIFYVGATPVFADVTSESDLNISPAAIEQALTSRTKAIIVMHYGGYPCDMPAIMDIARRHNLKVVEDAAHAPGASLDNTKIGAWGDIASFSFFPNKNMTTAEGGMLVTNNDKYAARMRTLRSHGMTTLTWDRHRGHAWSYDVVDLGYNYRIDEIRSALGIEQLKKLPHHNECRRLLTQYYRAQFNLNELGATIPFENSRGVPSFHILPLLLPKGSNRVMFTNLMKEKGVQTSLHYPPIHLFQYYRNHRDVPPASLKLTEEISSREVTLPLYPSMTQADIDYVVSSAIESITAMSSPVEEKKAL